MPLTTQQATAIHQDIESTAPRAAIGYGVPKVFRDIFKTHFAFDLNSDAGVQGARRSLEIVGRGLSNPQPDPYSRKRAEAGDPLRTVGGSVVRFVCHSDLVINGFPVIGVVDGQVETWRADGSYRIDSKPDDLDLVMAVAR